MAFQYGNHNASDLSAQVKALFSVHKIMNTSKNTGHGTFIKKLCQSETTKYMDGNTEGVDYPTQITIADNLLTFIVDSFGTYSVEVVEKPAPTAKAQSVTVIQPKPSPIAKPTSKPKPSPTPEAVLPEQDIYEIYIKATENKISKTTNLKTGDYLLFGKYLSQSILFRVIDFDLNGNPMIFADEILCYKAFSAAQGGAHGLEININDEFDMDYENNPDIKNCIEYIEDGMGSNRWSQSSIRDWLNSSNKAVQYKTYPPDEEALSKAAGAYADEPGFLYNFSKQEQDVIIPVTHKSLLVLVGQILITKGILSV